ncbi:gliding motility-associated-like protein [Neolewinella xylanilytica]|uniref:Gliding motility-associated-like protein n=1 Tax=Neolewinella xylanilytica TaxID=1514080 RepID=A0A2S6I248_9BACT|nr:PKD domain-containing protein [Neolewinella xylanilytica]PPK85220.1 gliding motility-associated-like protein [Neolewinella xylanilytica]
MNPGASGWPLFWVTLLFFLPSVPIYAQSGAPAIQVCGGGQTVCLESETINLCVTVAVDPAYPEKIDSFEINWDDGSLPEKFAGTNTSFNVNHRYDFTGFFGTCSYVSDRKLVSLSTYIEGELRPIESIFPLTALNPPEAKFDNFPSVVCVNEEIYLQDESCPVSGLLKTYDFGDGSPITEFGWHTFTTTGEYTVKLLVENDCGTDEATRRIRVIDQPVARAEPDSGFVRGYDDPYRICLDGTATLRVDGSASVGLASRRWSVEPALGTTIAGGGSAVGRISFTQPGRYTVWLSGQNENCATEARDSFQVEVVTATVLRLDRQPDVCEAFAYCPTPTVEGATYTLNGQPLTGCSPVLEEGTYFVEAFLANELCGDATQRDTFTISAQATAVIAESDTTLCDRDGPLRLTATPPGGQWTLDGQPFDGTVDPATLAAGTHRIAYGNEPCLLSDAITLEIVSSAVTVPDDTEVCIDAGPVTFTATPAGGIFLGTGIDSTGRFDPLTAGLGEHEITYEWADGELAGCGGANTFRVTVSELSAAFETLSCAGNEVCFSVDDPASYESVSWNFGDGRNATGPAPCHTFSGPGTYDVTVSVGRGPCVATFTRSVSIAPAPVARFTLDYDPDRCSDLPVIITNTSLGSDLVYNWQLNGVTFADTTDPGELLLTSRMRDSLYEITLEVSNGCTTSSSSERILVRPLPTSDFGTDQNSYCSGDTVLLANNAIGQPTAYEWTLGGRIIGTDSLPPLIVHETATRDTLEVCLTTYNDCGFTTTCRPIVFTPTDVEAFFNVAPTVVCVDDTVRLTSFATPGVSVRYDFGNGNGGSDPNATVVYRQPGTYRIVQRAFGCGSDVFEKTVSVVPRPTARFEPPAAICAGAPVTFLNLSGDSLRASWDFGDGSAPLAEYSPSHAFDTAGRYEVCLTVTSMGPDGCDHTVCMEVEVSPAPRPGFTYTDSLCLGSELAIQSTAVGDGLSCTYRFGDGATATDCSPVHNYAAAGAYNVTQVVTDSRGCRDSTRLPVFVRNLPEADFRIRSPEVCSPDSIDIVNLTTGAVTYQWDFGDSRTESTMEPTHAYDGPGEYTVTLTASDGFCSDSHSERAIVHESPVALIAAADTAVCFGEPAVLADGSSGPVATRIWDYGDGTTGFSAAADHPFPAAGNYLVRLRVTTGPGCADSTSQTIVVHEPVAGELAQPDAIACNGQETASLEWQPGGGTEPFAFAWSDGAVTQRNPGLPAGFYAITVTDANGCVRTDSATVSEPAAVLPGAEATTVTCFGGSDGALDLDVSGGTAPYLIRWEDGGSGNRRSELAAGAYAVTVTDGRGCVLPFSLEVPENPPLVVIDSITGISCYGENDAAVDLVEIRGGTGPYAVTLTGTGYRETGTTLSRFDRLAPDVYTLEVADALGCLEERDLVVAQPDRVDLDILQDSVYLKLGDTVQLTTRYNATEPVFSWGPAYGLSCNNCPNPVARPHYTQRYEALVTDARGCSDRDTVVVAVEINREVYLPNTFTPNGDGRNDVFRVRSAYPDAIAEVVSFEIRDRWGLLLHARQSFPPNEPSFGWDGTFQDAPVAGGQYVYQVRVRFVDGFEKTISGSILILR